MAARFGNILYWLGVVVAVLCLLAAGSWIVQSDKNKNDARAHVDEVIALISNASADELKASGQTAASALDSAKVSLEVAERRYQEAWWIAAGLAFIGVFVCTAGWVARYVLRGPS